MPPYIAAQPTAHITCLSCVAATVAQIIQDHAEKFLEEMNSAVLAPQLKVLGLIPETVESKVLQSKNKKDASAHLLNHLKADADEESVMEVFRIASKEEGYGRMKAFAAGMLRQLQQGLYCCAGTQMLLLCTPLCTWVIYTFCTRKCNTTQR